MRLITLSLLAVFAVSAAGAQGARPEARLVAQPDVKPDVKPDMKPDLKPDALPSAMPEEKLDEKSVWDCMNAAQTREAVAEHKLIPPMRAARNIEKSTRAEPLQSRLCQSHEAFIYELTLLRRDGKVIRLFINAANGAVLKRKAHTEREKPKDERAKAKEAH